MYDIAIIGGGPAGVSAAVNAKILNKNFIWFGTFSKKVARAEIIENFIGLPHVTGSELNWTFKNHLDGLGIAPIDKIITGVYDTGEGFTLLAGQEDFEARTVILCLGVEAAKPVDGEEEFLGRGVSYCATCDGNLYKGKTISVIAFDKRFEGEIEYLCSLAEKAYVTPLYKGYEIKADNAEIILKQPKKFVGDMRLKEVKFADLSVEVDGAFILRGATPPTALVHGLKIEGSRIVVDRMQRTNIMGVFAAGDCTGAPYQYAKAIGEGNVAVHAAVELLSGK